MNHRPVGSGSPSPKGAWIFGRYCLCYGSIWAAVLLGFIGISHPLLKRFADRQVKARLLSDAAIIDEYLGTAGAFTPNNREVLDQFCKRLNRPAIGDEWVTLFSDKSEVLADSKMPNPVAERILARPEVAGALKDSASYSVRYSPIARRRMALLAIPHVHLGEAHGVVRVGLPYSSVDDSLWWAYVKIAAAGLGMSIIAASFSSLYQGFQEPRA